MLSSTQQPRRISSPKPNARAVRQFAACSSARIVSPFAVEGPVPLVVVVMPHIVCADAEREGLLARHRLWRGLQLWRRAQLRRCHQAQPARCHHRHRADRRWKWLLPARLDWSGLPLRRCRCERGATALRVLGERDHAPVIVQDQVGSTRTRERSCRLKRRARARRQGPSCSTIAR